MSLEAIEKRITDEAAEEAAEIVEAAKAEREEALAAARKSLEEEYAQDLQKLGAESSDTRNRLSYHVRREEERRYETAARQAIDSAIDSAVRRLASLQDAEYLELISGALRRCSFRGEVEVVISPSDEKRITQQFLSAAGDSVRTFSLSRERHDQIGGVILRSGRISLNATFSRIAALSHEQIVRKLSDTAGGRSG